MRLERDGSDGRYIDVEQIDPSDQGRSDVDEDAYGHLRVDQNIDTVWHTGQFS
jgi:hypothetical protein